MSRSQLPYAVMVLTDGQSGDINEQTTRNIEAAGGVVLSIGVGNANQAELNMIASDPDDYWVYNSNDWGLLEEIKFKIAAKLCGGDANRSGNRQLGSVNMKSWVETWLVKE